MILLYLLAGIVVLNCAYLILFSKFVTYTQKDRVSEDIPPISLIVCAKNEADHLTEHIPYWLDQDHPNYEIILINDASSDNSLDIIEAYAKTYTQIKIVDVENNEAFWGNKKYALTLGIKKAKHQHMIFTDADCKPASRSWLRKVASNFISEKEIVLGFGSYQYRPGLLNKIIRYETVMTAVQYFSYALAGSPYMGVGRNLGYTQKVFYDNRGFMGHMEIRSGDDDLFVNQAADKTNTAICVDKNSFTISKPKTSWKQWFNQKRRHITTSKHYKFKHKFLLASFYSLNILFWIVAVTSLIMIDWRIPLILILFRVLLFWILFGKAFIKLDQKDLIFFYPFLEIFLLLLQLSIFISNRSSKPIAWK
jgi:glycosyltransferase involved in cell wall biosynthesis